MARGTFVYGFGPFELDPHKRWLTWEGTRVQLADSYFGVLLELVSRAPDVVSRRALSIAGWGSDVNENSIEQAVSHLRKSLGVNGATKLIETAKPSAIPPLMYPSTNKALYPANGRRIANHCLLVT